MKKRVICTAILAAGLAFGGGASAAPWSWTGTLATWQASGGGTGVITDGDGDALFTLFGGGTTIPDGSVGSSYVTITEQEIGAKDFYNVSLDWDVTTGFASGYAGGGQLAYTVTSLGGESIAEAALDSIVIGTGTTALAFLRDLPANTVFANLDSTDGGRDPVSGYVAFGTRTLIGVQDVVQPSGAGVLTHLDNSFVTAAVPEPGQASLVGVGLLGLMLARRRHS